MKTITLIVVSLGSAVSLWCILQGLWATALIAHAVSALILTRWWPWQELGKPGDFDLTLCWGMPCAGPFWAIMFRLLPQLGKKENIAEDFLHYINAGERAADLPAAPPSRMSPRPEQMDSLADVLRSDASNDEKRLAIAALAQLETPQTIEILRDTVLWAPTEVRFYAASVLGQLEERLSMRLDALVEAAKTDNDPQLSAGLAQAYFDYAYYRLVTGDRRLDCLEEASRHVQIAAANGLTDAWLLAGRIALESNDLDKAERCFASHLDTRPDDVRGDLWMAEIAYLRGQFGPLRRSLTAAQEKGKIPHRMEEAVLAWTRSQKGSAHV